MSPRKTRTEVLQFLGLAHRAGAVTSGTGAVREAIRGGSAKLVLTADDASETQLDKIRPLLGHRGVPERPVGSRAELGGAIGRPSVTAVAIDDEGFAARILELMDS